MFLRAFKSLILSGLVLLIAAGVGPALAARALCAPEYDADGNLTFDGRQDPPWDAERGDQIGSLLDGGEAGARRASHATTRMASQNRLVEIQTRAGLETVGAVFPSFRQRMDYDDLGRRIRSRTWHKIGGTERIARDDVFVYEGWRLSAILSGHDGSLRQRFAWGLDLSGTVGGAGNVSGLLVFEDSVPGQSHFPRYDGNGNVIGLIAANDPASGAPAGTPGAGGATAAYEYDPFGNALGATGHAAARNPFRFSTTFQDPVTRHSYYGYRFYDPANGRWLSRDPIGEAGGLNLYGFVGNDPVNAVDVLGMADWQDVSSFFGDFARIGGSTAWNGIKTVGRGLILGSYDLTHAAQGFAGDIGYEIGMYGFDAVMTPFSLGVYDEAIWWRDSFNALNNPCYRKLLSESMALNLYHDSEEYGQVTANAALGNLAGAGIMRFGNVNLRNPFRRKVEELLPTEASVVAPKTGGLLPSGRRGQALLAEYRGYRAQGFTAGQARYLTQPYQGMGHHWLARRIGYDRLNLPRSVMESQFNIMGRGMSRGRFYRRHALADPHFHGAAFPRELGGAWRASELGISTASRPLRWWYATPNASRYTIGGAAAAGGVWWWLSGDDEGGN